MEENEILLVLRDNAKTELMQIKTVEAGMTHLNKLKSFETWVRAEKKDAELQNLIAEQKLRTQRILGELIKDGKQQGEISTGKENLKNVGLTLGKPDTLGELGITHKQSATFQKIAEIPQDKFEAFILEKKHAVNNAVAELTTKGALYFAGTLRDKGNAKLRITGYLGNVNAMKFKAFAYYKEMEQSDAVASMVGCFLDSIPEGEMRLMMQAYLGSLTIK